MKETTILSSTSSPYLNRELSLLAFQARVLEEAQDESNPLLERFKFLSILGSNLEEFFMVRVAGLKRQLEEGNRSTGKDGMTPHDQLHAIREETVRLVATANHLREETLLPALKESGIEILAYDDLNETQRSAINTFFAQSIFPVLTPLAFDAGHPFPHISNLSFNLSVLICDTKLEQRFARIKIPETLPQLIPLESESSSKQAFLWIEDVITANLSVLFPGMTILDA
ncbi:MAG: RNA degradosome polyphosphate kinase, partial [Candidatus Obscuribacterales bacterium]|nr:RNA degradosome polyphosphate kinase [Candidatus Obscuribacterales bacterium]